MSSSNRITYRVAALQDALDIAPRLREQDRIELEAATGKDPVAAITAAVEATSRMWAAVIDGQVECIFGIGEATRQVGVPWMLATDAVVEHQRALVEDALSIVEDMQEAYPLLTNFVHSDNTAAIAWLRHLGFSFGDPIEHGPAKQPFIPFFRRQHQHV
jgi:hypothetical protein